MSELVIVKDGSGTYTYAFKSEDGKIIDLDTAIENSLETLEDNNSGSLSYLGDSDEERTELLKKMIQAEIATLYPDITNSEDLGLSTQELVNSNIVSTGASGDARWGLTVAYENIYAYSYHHGVEGVEYKSNLVEGYITEDRANYIVTEDSGLHYVGPGVQLESNAETFQQFGIDVNSLTTGSLVNCDIVEQISQIELESHYQRTRELAQEYGFTLTEQQVQAVADKAYWFGPNSDEFLSFFELYKQYGDTEELADNYTGFYKVDENTTQEDLIALDNHGNARRASAWLLFHYGKYIANTSLYNPSDFKGTSTSSNSTTNNDNNNSTSTTNVDDILNSMTLDEKIQQLFMVQTTVSAGDFANTSYGGIIANNGKGTDYSGCSGVGTSSKIRPFVATDDEGGSVYRAYTNSDGARTYGNNKDYDKLYEDEITKSNALLNMGITLNLGPVSDVISDSNGALYNRSYSGDAATVKECIKQVLTARSTTNVNNVSMSSSLKHYPGYLNTSANSDFGIATCTSSVDEINKNIDVFLSGINEGAESVMVSNIIYTNLDANNPATLSSTIISKLRSNFDGVIMTDDIGNASALTGYPNRYRDAILAGNDVLLMGIDNANDALSQIKQAVEEGTITEERINESVRRVLNWKAESGVLNATPSSTGTTTGTTTGSAIGTVGATVSTNVVGTGNISIEETIDASKNVKGGIKVIRKDENGTDVELKYTSTGNFNALVASKSEETMNYYTLQQNVQNSNATSSTSSGTSDFSGSTSVEICWNFFISKGLSEYCVAGIIGNLLCEGLDPNSLVQGVEEYASNIGYGIAQWSYGRKTQLEEYAATMGKEPSDLQLQLEFLWLETDPTADRGSYANLQWGGACGEYNWGWNRSEELYNNFINSQSVEEATFWFCYAHERPGVIGYDKRCDEANKQYNIYAGTTTSSSSNINASSSLDNFLFIGDSRYNGIKTQLSALGSNISVCAVDSSSPAQWVDTTSSGSGNVNGTSIQLPDAASVKGVSVMLGVNRLDQITEMQTFLNNLHNRYPNVTIYVNSVYNLGTAYGGTATNEGIASFNNEMRDFCNQNSWANYVDITSGLNDENNYLKSQYSSDGLHIIGDGISVIVANIQNAILSGTNSSTVSNETTGSTSTTSISTDGNYSIVVANKSTTNVTVTTAYEHTSSYFIQGVQNKTTSTSQHAATPAGTENSSSNTKITSTSIAYQPALKNYTLYFEFLWAVLVNTQDTELVENWANLVCDKISSNLVTVTVFTDSSQQTSTSVLDLGNTSLTSYAGSTGEYYIDNFNQTQTTTTTTIEYNSKLGITYADTWLLKYENTASTYADYQSGSSENIVEKIDGDSSEANIIKILREDEDAIELLNLNKDIINTTMEKREKVAFMVDILNYILEVVNGTDDGSTALTDILDTSLFDLSNANTSTKKVLLYTSLNTSDEDKELLYKFVEQTGSNCDKEEKEYIACVILNRALSGKFGTSDIEQIINQSYQFENYDSSINDSVTPSDETKSAVDNVISTGDKSDYSVYFATPETAKNKKWDQTDGEKGFVNTKKGDIYNFYTTKDISAELKKLESTINVSENMSTTSTAQKIVEWAEAQVGKSSYYNAARGTEQVAKNTCAAFVKSAYYEAGLEYINGNAIDLPHPNKIITNSDGTVDWSGIPVGAIIVSQGVPVDGVDYGHVCLYIGNGYIIEAGGNAVQKKPIDESYGGKGHNCAPFLGWGFAANDQDAAYSMLVNSSSIDTSNYNEGWTDLTDTVGNWAEGGNSSNGTGIQGIYKMGNKAYKVYSQGCGPWADTRISEPSKYIANAGCGITSLSIILTGLGYDITPDNFAGQRSAGDSYLQAHMSSYGVSYRQLSSLSEAIEELKKGNPVLCHTSGKTGNKSYTGHYVTLLGINSQGQLFLGDPGTSGRNSKYYSPDQLSGLDRFYVVYK